MNLLQTQDINTLLNEVQNFNEFLRNYLIINRLPVYEFLPLNNCIQFLECMETLSYLLTNDQLERVNSFIMYIYNNRHNPRLFIMCENYNL